MLNQKHLIDGLRIGIPFIANLPSRVDTFVKPLLQARVDGAPLALTAQTKPFAASLDSDLKLHLDPLDLVALQSYAPETLPVRLAQGKLAADLDLHFAKTGDQPTVQLGGSLDLSGLDLSERRAARPCCSAAAIHLQADALEPLRQVWYHLAELRIDQPVAMTWRATSPLAINLLKLAQPAPAAARSKKSPDKSSVDKPEEAAGRVAAQPLDFSRKAWR